MQPVRLPFSRVIVLAALALSVELASRSSSTDSLPRAPGPRSAASAASAAAPARRRPLEEVEVRVEDYFRAAGPAPFPTRAFMITTRAAQASGRTAHAVAQVRERLHIDDIEFVIGGNVPDAEVGCARVSAQSPPNSCAFGVVWANQQIWRAVAAEGLASALVLEDDVLIHDDAEALLPQYWQRVPPDFEFVYLGHLPAWLMDGEPPPPDAVRTGEAPYCTHAYVVTAASAARLALLFDQVFRGRGRDPGASPDAPPELTYLDIKIDLFLPNHALRTALDRSKWITFGSTAERRSEWGGVDFLSNRKAWLEPLRACHCDEDVRPECRGFLPIIGAGLAFQHYHCSNMTKLRRWVEQYRRDLPALRNDTSVKAAHWVF